VSLLTWVRCCPCPYVAAGRHLRPMVDCHMWVAVFVCGWSASFFGWLWWRCGHWWLLAFMGNHEAVVVKSMVGGSDEHGWWWWKEEMVVVGRK